MNFPWQGQGCRCSTHDFDNEQRNVNIIHKVGFSHFSNPHHIDELCPLFKFIVPAQVVYVKRAHFPAVDDHRPLSW